MNNQFSVHVAQSETRQGRPAQLGDELEKFRLEIKPLLAESERKMFLALRLTNHQ